MLLHGRTRRRAREHTPSRLRGKAVHARRNPTARVRTQRPRVCVSVCRWWRRDRRCSTSARAAGRVPRDILRSLSDGTTIAACARMRSLSLAGLLFVVACGGATAGVEGDDAGAASDGTRSDVGAAHDPRPDSDLGPDSGGTCTMRVPKQNRPQGGQCPSQRGAGMNGSGGAPGECTKDADCTAGRNGRCLFRGFGAQILQCSYDECLVDSDCAGNVPCDCRASASSSAPNVCGTGSNCRVNGDCGSCGWCSPSEAPTAFCFGRNTTYFCHTPSDTCFDDTDCGSGSCNLDPMTHHWACVTVCAPPPP